jgi:methylenetetrahydrofolate dehydrogenase (NADP+)/methenyltetrahydrofolate cyclohydrolase
MPCNIFDGKAFADKMLAALGAEIKSINVPLSLAIIVVGQDESSRIYVRNKLRVCKELGIACKKYSLNDDVPAETIIAIIKRLNSNKRIHGILLQLPLPSHLDGLALAQYIRPEKDVDGLNLKNTINIYAKKNIIIPCTPKAVLKILDSMNIDVDGKHVVMIGRSFIVGKPLALLMLNRNATVTICHSHTKNLADIVKSADVVLSATGKAHLVTAVKYGAVVIDIGICRSEGKIVGDVDPDVASVASNLTPVPNGIGPVTVAMLIDNLVQCYKMQCDVHG